MMTMATLDDIRITLIFREITIGDIEGSSKKTRGFPRDLCWLSTVISHKLSSLYDPRYEISGNGLELRLVD